MSIKIERSNYEPIPEGIYNATIASIELDDTSVYGSQLKFQFSLDPSEGIENGKELTAWASAKFSPKSKLFGWTKSILGNFPNDYNFNSDDLLNKRVQLVVGRIAKPDGTDFNKIENIKSLPAVARIPSDLDAQKITSEVNSALEEAIAEVPA